MCKMQQVHEGVQVWKHCGQVVLTVWHEEGEWNVHKTKHIRYNSWLLQITVTVLEIIFVTWYYAEVIRERNWIGVQAGEKYCVGLDANLPRSDDWACLNASLKKCEAKGNLQKWTSVNVGEEMQYKALCKGTVGIWWKCKKDGGKYT